MVRRRDSSLGGTTRSPPASPSLPVILSNSCRFCDIRRNNAPGWLKLLGIADADSTSMSRRVHSSLEQFFDKARKSGSHLTLRWSEGDSNHRSHRERNGMWSARINDRHLAISLSLRRPSAHASAILKPFSDEGPDAKSPLDKARSRDQLKPWRD
jgi:hypothetical protein